MKTALIAIAATFLFNSCEAFECEYDCQPNPCALDNCAWSVDLEALYLKTTSEAYNYGTVAVRTRTTPPIDDDIEVKTLVKQGDWEFCWRGSIGCLSPECDWEFDCEWTHLVAKADSHSSVDAPADPRVLTTVINNFIPVPVILASNTAIRQVAQQSRFRFYCDQLDFTFAKPNWFCWNNLTLVPSFGLRLIRTTTEEHDKIAVEETSLGNITVNDSTSKIRDRFYGAGAVAGINFNYPLRWNWALVGNAKASWVYGKWKEKQRSKQAFRDTTPSTVDHFASKADYFEGLCEADYFIGLAWNACICQTQMAFEIGWEQDFLFDHIYIGFNPRNISFQGLRVAGMVEF